MYLLHNFHVIVYVAQRRALQGPPIAPSTEALCATSTDELSTSSSLASTDVKDCHDGTSVEYNNQMSDRDLNIETSDELENQQQGTVRSHRFSVQAKETICCEKPVNEGNLQEVAGPPKGDRQANLINKIEEMMGLDDVKLEPGTFLARTVYQPKSFVHSVLFVVCPALLSGCQLKPFKPFKPFF